MPVNTERLASKYRAATLDVAARRILVTNFCGSAQEQDLSRPANCGGFGRVRHFRRDTSKGWPANSLPIDPACARLGIGPLDSLNAQVFQNAACNWRCWYCFVPYDLLSADLTRSSWMSASDLIALYMQESERPLVIDLSGGQPELTPEWVVWIMDTLVERGLQDSVYLWSDDNLSCDYFWRYLSAVQQEAVIRYPRYGRVACFKGFDAQSFAFNTNAEEWWFDRQFELMKQLIASRMDVYAYATFTTPSSEGIAAAMRSFVDRLQALDENLPLRTVPLEIQYFSPIQSRLRTVHDFAFDNQWKAIEAWTREIESRFSTERRTQPINCVPFRSRG